MNLAIDLYCGLGGWAEGFLAEGYTVIGFDTERHDYGTGGYPGQLVLQDVLTLHGSQFKGATVIVASPPCQAYSYRAMPWKRAKALPPPSNELFDACFRIQREACEAAGGFIPLIVENVKGAQPWVGRAAWHYGSFYLWGDLPALMPITRSMAKIPGQDWSRYSRTGDVSPHWNMQAKKNTGGSWFNIGSPGQAHVGQNPDGRKIKASCRERRWEDRPIKRLRDAADNFGWSKEHDIRNSNSNSNSNRRKAASAQIAKIPFPLANHIARVFAQ